MSSFKLIISGGENTIEIAKDVLQAEIFIDTINNDVMSRANGVLAKLLIKGKINEKNSAPSLELFRWSKDFNSDTQYRKVELYVYSGSEETGCYRHYEFGRMFVVDYKETYSDAKEGASQYGSFELSLTQQDDSWDSVESFPN